MTECIWWRNCANTHSLSEHIYYKTLSNLFYTGSKRVLCSTICLQRTSEENMFSLWLVPVPAVSDTARTDQDTVRLKSWCKALIINLLLSLFCFYLLIANFQMEILKSYLQTAFVPYSGWCLTSQQKAAAAMMFSLTKRLKPMTPSNN